MKIIQTIRVTTDSEDPDGNGYEVDEELMAEERKTDFAKTKQELVDMLMDEGASKVELIDFEVQEDGE